MSTKSTVTYGDNFHLYTEMGEYDRIHLKIEGNNLDFAVYPGSVDIAIPADIWEHIRQYSHPVMKSKYRGKTDEEIKNMITAEFNDPEYQEFMLNMFGESPDDGGHENRINLAIHDAVEERNLCDMIEKFSKKLQKKR